MIIFLFKKEKGIANEIRKKVLSPQAKLARVPQYILSNEEMGKEVMKEKVNLENYETASGDPIPENLEGYKLYYF